MSVEYIKITMHDDDFLKTLIKQAIKQAEKQEPVAWVNDGETRILRVNGWNGYGALYTYPPKREWVGLTDEDIDLLERLYAPADHCLELIRQTEAKLREKNEC